MKDLTNVTSVEEQEAFWDEIAKPCSHYERRSEYADEFLRRSGIMPGETVFDMGCGSGTLCLPLADDGHRVFCADLSGRMLQSVRDVIEEEGLELLTLKKLSWQEDWSAQDLPVCDLAFASRSILGVDPAECAVKLSGRASRRVCITLPVDSEMFKHPDSSYQSGSDEEMDENVSKCVKAVKDLGYDPVLEYMEHGSKEGCPSWLFIRWDITDL